MSFDEHWFPILTRLSRLELLVVNCLVTHGGERAATLTELAAQLRTRPDTLGRALRELNGRLIQYRAGWGRRPVARLRLLDSSCLPEACDWLDRRAPSEPRPIEGSRDRAIPGPVESGPAVLNQGSGDRAIPGSVERDSLLGMNPHVHHHHDHDRLLADLEAEDRAAVERLTREVCGRKPSRAEAEMWRELFRERGLTRAQLEAGVAEVRGRLSRPPRTMHYFRPHLMEVLDEDRNGRDDRGTRPAPRRRGARAGGAGAAAAPRARWEEWAADVPPAPAGGAEDARHAGQPDV